MSQMMSDISLFPLVFALIVLAGMRLHKVPAGRENNGAVVHGNKMYLLLDCPESQSSLA